MSCFQAGAVFVQQGKDWVAPARSIKADSDPLNFFYVVDSNTTPTFYPYGLVFVGVIRLFQVSDVRPNIRLSQNKDLYSPTPELITTYHSAVVGDAAATTNLDRWGNVEGTVPLFRTPELSPTLRKFDLFSQDSTAELHARLYRFKRGGGLECIPFDVGTGNNALHFISAKIFDVLGTTRQPPDIGLSIQ
jgi:hypothetical protein